MVRKNLVLLITLFSLLCSVFSIYLHTKSYKNDYCVLKQVDSDDNIRISYLINGDNDEEKSDVRLYNPNNIVVYERRNESGGEHQYKVSESGLYKLCFYIPKPGDNYISFEFFTDYEKGHTLDMAKDRKN